MKIVARADLLKGNSIAYYKAQVNVTHRIWTI